MDPFTITSGVISVANGTFTLTTNFWKLKNVDNDLKICLHLHLMMTQDINDARRLRDRKYPHHHRASVPDPLFIRANKAIDDLEAATIKMSKSIEAVRVEKSMDNKISIANRFRWVYNMKENFSAQQWVVNTAHARVLSVINSMEALPDVRMDLLAPPPVYEEVLLRSPSQKRSLKGKSTTVAVVETEQATDINSEIPFDPLLLAEGSPAGPCSPSSRPVHEEYTEEDLVNEKILARWQISRGRPRTRDDGIC